MSFWLLKKYRKEADDLLKRHGLSVPEDTADALAKRIMFVRFRADKKAKLLEEKARLENWDARDQVSAIEEALVVLESTSHVRTKGHRKPLTPLIKKAITHTLALLRNTKAEKQPSRPDSIPNHQKKLHAALSNVSVKVRLTLGQPSVNVNQLLKEMSEGKELGPDVLERLMQSLTAYIDGDRSRTGRPKDTNALIIASAVRCWTMAGKQSRYSYNDIDGLRGEFIEFLRDLFATCEVDIPKDAAIQWRLRKPENMFDLMKKVTTQF